MVLWVLFLCCCQIVRNCKKEKGATNYEGSTKKMEKIVEVNFEEQEGKKAFWHTSAHVLAQAVKRLYPETKCAIGSTIENGFYYDFQFEFSFSEDHLKTIEAEMRKIVKESLSLQVYEKSKEEALSFMENADEKYKVELIQELNDTEQISFYKQGEYEEFCAGPHISNVCQIKAIKLLSVAGAYWRGSEKIKCLRESMVYLFQKRHNWMNICIWLKKQK